ncbi:MAG: 4-(cytidine 5'-diphospho)-2-C-methyl-D-erythritol kinase [Desulfovibrionaceae bacterium]|nr:4-(cytidine 5'-diphospho)-2-C-methyl-D-erythritol kinase [Desulfovibrionaceae bacterium]
MSPCTCGCKVNLGLAITGRRADGYHELDSFFYPLPKPSDTLLIEESPRPGLTIETDCEAIDPQNNTLTRAYDCLCKTLRLPNFRIGLKKGIPAGAGLGGGSSDAASFLRYLGAHYSIKETELHEAAKKTGADVPFFLANIPARVRGIGERIDAAQLSCMPCILLLVYPGYGIPTGPAFAKYDAARGTERKHYALTRPSFAHTLSLSQKEGMNRRVIPWSLNNDLEDVVLSEHADLVALKSDLFTQTALAVGMSGSGASLYALYPQESETEAKRMADRMQKRGYAAWVNKLA